MQDAERLLEMYKAQQTKLNPATILAGFDNEEEFILAKAESRKSAAKKLFLRTYTQLMEQNYKILFEGESDDVIKIAEDLFVEKKKSMDFCHITINLPQDYNVDNIHKLINKSPFRYIEKWIACVEYYTSHGHHPHIHMAVKIEESRKSKATKKTIISDFARRWHTLDNAIDIKPKGLKGIINTIKYIKGIKKDDDKMLLVEQDRIWRSDNGFSEIYGDWSETLMDS